ncbi:MAG: ABC transporter substrate-binding protein [Chloroflexi bacterium]|nr:ABC transporter substrate-binding protein [Chloroflexota bacterium]
MENKGNYWTGVWNRRLSRRQALRGVGKAGIGLAGLTLIGCAAPSAPAPTPKSTAPTPKPAGPTPTPAPTYGGTLIGAMNGSPAFDPGWHFGGSTDQTLYYLVYNSLLHEEPDSSLAPELAESWEVPDPTTFVFKLKRGVKFHDGTDFNATVAKAHYERLGDEGHKGPQAIELRKSFKSAEALDDYTYKMTIKTPNSSFLYQNTRSSGPGMIPQPYDAKKKNNDLKISGIGTGPFVADGWLMDERASVKKFSGYWEKGVPYLDAFVWRVVPSSDVQVTMLKTGEIQLIAVAQTKDLPVLKADPNIVVAIKPGGKRKTIQFNMVNSPFKEKAIRQAVAYAIDRVALTQAVWQGLYTPGEGPFPPASWAYDPAQKGYPFDLAKAKEKMVEGGYPNGFEAKVSAASSRPDEVTMSEVIKEMLAKIGIRLNIAVTSDANWTVIRNTDDKEHQLLASSSGTADDPGNLIEVYYSSKMKIAMAKAKNPQLDSLLEKAQATYNQGEQKRYFQELGKLITEDVWSILTIAYPVNIIAYRKNVHSIDVGLNYSSLFTRKTWLSK